MIMYFTFALFLFSVIINYCMHMFIIIILIILIIIIKLYCHIQYALHDELECRLALTHIVPIYIQ